MKTAQWSSPIKALFTCPSPPSACDPSTSTIGYLTALLIVKLAYYCLISKPIPCFPEKRKL
jgi:hypothetical protein